MDEVNNSIDFEKYYNYIYKKVIDNYFDDILKNKKNLIISRIVVYLFTSTIIPLIVINFSDLKIYVKDYIYEFFCVYFLISSIINIVLALFSFKKKISSINDLIIKDLIMYVTKPNPDKIIYEPFRMLNSSSLKSNDLFNLGKLKYTGSNYVSSYYNKNFMVFSDINIFYYDYIKKYKDVYKYGKKFLRTTTKKQKKYIFNGMYIGASMNKKSKAKIYLIPNYLSETIQTRLMNYITYKGTEVMLENREFSLKYKVYSDDEIEARRILSLSLMEKINNLDKIIPQKKYIVFKEGTRFAMFIEGLNMNIIKKNKFSFFRNENKEKKIILNMYNSINNLYMVHDILDLGKDNYEN